MVVVLFVVAATLTSAPIIVAVLVGVASRREDCAWTLAGLAPGAVQAVARRILGLQSRGIGWLQHAGGHSQPSLARGASTVQELAHAEIPRPAPGSGDSRTSRAKLEDAQAIV